MKQQILKQREKSSENSLKLIEGLKTEMVYKVLKTSDQQDEKMKFYCCCKVFEKIQKKLNRTF